MADKEWAKSGRGASRAEKNRTTREPVEPNAINRLLISAVTESWPRTLRAIVVLLTLAVLALSTATGVAVVGPSIANLLIRVANGP